MRGAVVLAMLIALLTGAAGRAVAAGSLAALRAQGQLQVATLVQPATAVVPGQKAELVIEIATNTWFTGGTRVTVPEVPGLVILQNEQFATNATQIRSGQTWVVQRWTLDVFAQRAGAFTVPPVRLQVKVNAGEKGDIEGELFTPATDIDVQLPDELARVNQWTAAPAFEVSQQFDRELDQLAVGDALGRDIVLQATDLMAMMLPAPATGQIDGLAVYPAPPVLENSNNRGESIARRIQRISYIAERPGTYQLPPLEFFWWDTAAGRLELVTLPGEVIEVAGTATWTRPAGNGWLYWLAALAAGALLAYLCLRGLRRLPRERVRALTKRATDLINTLRTPALPARLNPGSNAADEKAG